MNASINPTTGLGIVEQPHFEREFRCTDKFVVDESNCSRNLAEQHFIAKTNHDFQFQREVLELRHEHSLGLERLRNEMVRENERTRELFQREKIEELRFRDLEHRLFETLQCGTLRCVPVPTCTGTPTTATTK